MAAVQAPSNSAEPKSAILVKEITRLETLGRVSPYNIVRLVSKQHAALVLVAVLSIVPAAAAQQADPVAPPPASQSPVTPPTPGQLEKPQTEEERKRLAEKQIKQQERQRVLGIIPAFNTTSLQDAVALTPKQKFKLALRGAVDPFQFFVAAVDAGFSQLGNDYSEYGQGTLGYAKRFGASYADAFDGNILGNALFPSLLHEDPRYFRKGTGTIRSRLLYSFMTTIRCKSDSGNWVPNFGNVLGNLAAGGISNLYYPASERGAALTVERAFTVTAEGAFGALAFEFWPDIQRKLKHRH